VTFALRFVRGFVVPGTRAAEDRIDDAQTLFVDMNEHPSAVAARRIEILKSDLYSSLLRDPSLECHGRCARNRELEADRNGLAKE